MVAAVLQKAGITCTLVEDLMCARWEKLVWNIPFYGLSALTGDDVTVLLTHAPMRAQVVEIMHEVIAADNAQGLQKILPAETLVERMVPATEGIDHFDRAC